MTSFQGPTAATRQIGYIGEYSKICMNVVPVGLAHSPAYTT